VVEGFFIKNLKLLNNSSVGRNYKKFKIIIPFNRQQLADFLSVDRSAMSNGLCKMRDEGLIVFKKNAFELIGHE